MKPKISIIIPVRNREKLITRCLQSIINQTVKPYELIIVDNGSEDSTLKEVGSWAQQYKNCGIKIYIEEEVKQGPFYARQKGLLKATGDYVIFFDSDDLMHSDLVENVSHILSQNHELEIVCWKCRIHLLNGKVRISPFITGNPMESHLMHSLLRTDGYTVKKDFIWKVGGWFKPLPVWNDLELGVRLLLQNPTITVIDKILVEIFSQKDSITGESFSSKEGQWELSLEEIEKEINSSYHPSKDYFKKLIFYRKVILGALYKKEGNNNPVNGLVKNTISEVKKKDKWLLLFAYLYTSIGGRGAWRLIRKAYRR